MTPADPSAFNGTVLVETNATLQLTNVSKIDSGNIINHGEIESAAGINTIINVGAGTGSGTFANDGLIEVASGATTTGADGDFLTSASTLSPSASASEYLFNTTIPQHSPRT